MKKYYIFIVVLCFIIVGEIVFIFMNNNKKIEMDYNQKEENIKDNNNVNVIDGDEINKYLTYVPYYLPLDFNAYSNDISIDGVNQNVLIAMALSQGMNDYNLCNVEECGTYNDNPIVIKYLYDDVEDLVYGFYYYSLSYINELLDNMYNVQFYNLEETTSWDNTYAGAYGGFALQDNYFLMCSSGIGESLYHVGFVSDWIEEDNELIIYEVGAYWDTYLSLLKDYRNDFEIALSVNTHEEALRILEENKEQFTEYKHIFKKADNGYFWYSTESV